MTEWKEYKLEEIVSIASGFAYKGEYIGKGENLLLGMGCVSYKEKFLLSGARPYAGDCAERYYAKVGDIVLATRQQSDNLPILGMPAIIPEDLKDKKLIIGANLYRVTNNSDFDNKYIYWLLKTPDYVRYIASCKTGTTVAMITKSDIENFAFVAPDKSGRERILKIMDSLDDKIDLLHRENKTLEAMAETLFRQWFIEEAKEDWKENPLGKCIKLVGGGTPKTSEERFWNGNVFWLSGGDIASNHKSFVSSSEKSISEDGLNNSSAKLLPENAMVISARGTVGKYCLLSKPMAFSQSNYGILPIYNDCYFFTYLLVAYHIDELQSAAYGSVFDTITTKTFEGVSVLIPKEASYIVEFEKMIEPYFSKMKQNNKQIQTLIQQRDSLLPKLMSGEVKI